MGTDLAQFAKNGARVTDVDLSHGHLEHAQRNFALRKLAGRFVHHDAEVLPFENGEFDLVYSNGVIHHTPNTADLVAEIHRVLKPGGRAVVMVYAENSWHYWVELVFGIGLLHRMLGYFSMGEIMSRTVERSDASGARPLVKVYTEPRLRGLFAAFEVETVVQRQLTPTRWMKRIPGLANWIERVAGWNLIIKARKREESQG
jgi:SAM-dependent methyltransferase